PMAPLRAVADTAWQVRRDCRRGLLVQPEIWPGDEGRRRIRTDPQGLPGHARHRSPAPTREILLHPGALSKDAVAVRGRRRSTASRHRRRSLRSDTTVQLVPASAGRLPRPTSGHASWRGDPSLETDVIAARAPRGLAR